VDLPAILGRFHAEHPGIQLRLAQGGSAVLMDGVHEGRLELAVIGQVGPPPEGVTTTLLARDSLVLAFPPAHPLGRHKTVSLSSLAGATFVDFRADWALRTLADRAFAAAHVQRRTACEVNDMPTMLDLVAHGLGIGLVPRVARSYPADVRYVSPCPPVPTWDVAVAHLGVQPAGAAARALLNSLVEDARTLSRRAGRTRRRSGRGAG
jgi:DNA-binding transcriptional LysR family regulator